MRLLNRFRRAMWVAFLLVLGFGCFFIFSQNNQLNQSKEQFWLTLFAPLSNFSYSVFGGLSDWFVFYNYGKKERKELFGLRTKSAMLEAQEVEILSLREENQELRILLSLKSKWGVFRPIAVDIRFFVSAPHSELVFLNQGEDQGIGKGDAVLFGHCAFGQVVSVAKTSSQVLLISDPKSAISVETLGTHHQGILRGLLNADKSLLKATHFDPLAPLSVGDVIVTSGSSEAFPKGIPVGEVVEVQMAKNRRSQQLNLAPLCDYKSARHGLVLTRFEHGK